VEGRFASRISAPAPVYLAAVLEYLVAEILELAGREANNRNLVRIIPRHIQLSIRSDEELAMLLESTIIQEGGVTEMQLKQLNNPNSSSERPYTLLPGDVESSVLAS
jgi:hypothetical protein